MDEILNRRFEIPRERLEESIQRGLNRNHDEYDLVVPLRDVKSVEDMAFVRQDVLEALLRAIPLRNLEETIFPYAQASIEMYGIEPKGLTVGQTFVLKDKLLGIMTSMSSVFKEYATKGLSKMPPAQVYGLDKNGGKVMAFYIPPIVEYHDGRAVLLDGMHRSFICSSAGTTINGIHLRNICTPLPFDEVTWKDVSVVDQKPPIGQRYKNLDQRYFRDLTAVGIDG